MQSLWYNLGHTNSNDPDSQKRWRSRFPKQPDVGVIETVEYVVVLLFTQNLAAFHQSTRSLDSPTNFVSSPSD